MCEQIGWVMTAMGWSIAGLVWCLPFILGFLVYYDIKTEKLKERNQ